MSCWRKGPRLRCRPSLGPSEWGLFLFGSVYCRLLWVRRRWFVGELWRLMWDSQLGLWLSDDPRGLQCHSQSCRQGRRRRNSLLTLLWFNLSHSAYSWGFEPLLLLWVHSCLYRVCRVHSVLPYLPPVGTCLRRVHRDPDGLPLCVCPCRDDYRVPLLSSGRKWLVSRKWGCSDYLLYFQR